MTETLAHGYSSESTQRDLSNEYQQDRVLMVFRKSLHLCALDESSLSKGRVNIISVNLQNDAVPFCLNSHISMHNKKADHTG